MYHNTIMGKNSNRVVLKKLCIVDNPTVFITVSETIYTAENIDSLQRSCVAVIAINANVIQGRWSWDF